ncbi:enoyl-CoA hydratase/isomerase family protein [Maricaulis sp. D1M11]|uniref:enoyl-CoA hydratase/isomerase family protein n=1 Tax=Maricaulis sp. D1M11 TaxID=3076117 RepID=UPI0039B5C6D8
MTQTDLYLDRQGCVAHLVLNRPDKRNALSAAMWSALPALLAEAEADTRIRTLIVRGMGGHFASGADIGEFETVYATPESSDTYSRAIGAGLNALADFAKPSIAQIEGVCVGGGCGLALACDMRFAAPGARFAITPAKLGLVYPFRDTKRLIDCVGLAVAKDMLFSARALDSEEALQTGLINRIVPATDLAAEVAAYCDHMATLSPYSARQTKAMMAAIESGITEETPEVEALYLDAFAAPDFKEGFAAFLAKRKPVFPGHD